MVAGAWATKLEPMDTLGLILAVVDPTAGEQPALAKAGRLAEASGACLRVFCVDRDPRLVARLLLDPAGLTAARAAWLAARRDWLIGLAEPFARAGIRTEVEAAWDGPLHAAILREVGLCGPDLVVKDTHWHGPLRRGLFTSTDWYLVQDCPAPLLLAKPRPWATRPRVVAAVDPGHPDDPGDVLDHAILGAAARLTGALGGELAVVHALLGVEAALAAGVPLAGLPSAAEDADAARGRAGAMLATLVQSRGIAPGAAQVLDGAALEALPDHCARSEADLLVVGAVSRSRLYQRVIGSTAERLLDRIPCDLLVARAPLPA